MSKQGHVLQSERVFTSANGHQSRRSSIQYGPRQQGVQRVRLIKRYAEGNREVTGGALVMSEG